MQKIKQPYTLFKNIRKARRFADLSQKKLAEKLGVSDKTISAYETGRAIPPTIILSQIAEITKISLSDIVETPENEAYELKNSSVTKRIEGIEKRLSNIEQALVKTLDKK